MNGTDGSQGTEGAQPELPSPTRREYEAAVRHLRDRVFDQVSTDGNWEACGANWLRPDSLAWLAQRGADVCRAD
jgi:hypothetical protein